MELPLLLYSSYFCPEAAAQRYGLPFLSSRHFDVGWAKGIVGDISPTHSFEFYDRIMQGYDGAFSNQTGALVAFEIDFMDFNYLLYNELLTNESAYDTWATGLNNAAAKHGLPVQYCMGLSNEMMHTLTLSQVTTARASEDNFPGGTHASGWTEGSRWQIAYTALFLNAIGLRPFMDVVWSSPHCPGSPYPQERDNVPLQLAVALLSNGPLGLGDGPGCTNKSLVMQACMADGTLLHPSRAITPINAMYLQPNPLPDSELW